jgi:aminoglycoside phosphotransferase (APT) family kinase protein
MNRQWNADIEVSPELATRLIDRQFPDLALCGVAPFGVGWDNVAYLVNGAFVFRFPRRQVAVGLLETEARVLPYLAPYLPLPIPAPRYLGVPTDAFPYPFAGYPALSGITACRAVWTAEARVRCAEPLGCFLAALHAVPVDGPACPAGPGDELGRADMRRRLAGMRSDLLALASDYKDVDVADLARTLDHIVETTTPFAGPPAWVHGDLYPRHLLVNEASLPSGVIDWGDVHRGDTAIDLSIAFTLLSGSARNDFRQAYGPIDDAVWNRALFRGIHYGIILTNYGRDVGDDALRAVGEFTLRSAAL